MATIATHPWDPAEHLETREDVAAYLEAALEDGDPAVISAALGDIARSRAMAQIARDTDLESENLQKALHIGENSEFTTVLKVLKAIGLQLHATTSETQV
ncbi:MAG: addiction module antidote protein [Desulfococcaceae bacterium]